MDRRFDSQQTNSAKSRRAEAADRTNAASKVNKHNHENIVALTDEARPHSLSHQSAPSLAQLHTDSLSSTHKINSLLAHYQQNKSHGQRKQLMSTAEPYSTECSVSNACFIQLASFKILTANKSSSPPGFSQLLSATKSFIK